MPEKEEFLLETLEAAKEAVRHKEWDDAVDAMSVVFAQIRLRQDQEAREAEKKRRRY